MRERRDLPELQRLLDLQPPRLHLRPRRSLLTRAPAGPHLPIDLARGEPEDGRPPSLPPPPPAIRQVVALQVITQGHVRLTNNPLPQHADCPTTPMF